MPLGISSWVLFLVHGGSDAKGMNSEALSGKTPRQGTTRSLPFLRKEKLFAWRRVHYRDQSPCDMIWCWPIANNNKNDAQKDVPEGLWLMPSGSEEEFPIRLFHLFYPTDGVNEDVTPIKKPHTTISKPGSRNCKHNPVHSPWSFSDVHDRRSKWGFLIPFLLTFYFVVCLCLVRGRIILVVCCWWVEYHWIFFVVYGWRSLQFVVDGEVSLRFRLCIIEVSAEIL